MRNVPERYKDMFTDERWNEICELVSKKKMKIQSTQFTVSEIKFIINETPLTENQKKGAEFFYVKRMKKNQIAAELGYSEATIQYYKDKVSKALRATCCRIFK